MKQVRESNFELLRILAMTLVVVVHTVGTLGYPSVEDVGASPLESFTLLGFKNLSMICVNLFILISGYFGINPKWKSVLGLVFICLFWRAVGNPYFSAVFSPFKGWFVGVYFGLVLVSPILNEFAKSVGERRLRTYLLWFYGLEILTSNFIPCWDLFAGGYNLVSLAGLYLIGRYISLYPANWMDALGKWRGVLVWIGLSLFVTGFEMFVYSVIPQCPPTIGHIAFKMSGKFFSGYTSLHVLVSTVCVFLAFRKMRFSSVFVNWVAASSFAVFCSHTGVPLFARAIKNIAHDTHGAKELLFLAALIFCWWIGTVLVDQIRKLFWRGIVLFHSRMSHLWAM